MGEKTDGQVPQDLREFLSIVDSKGALIRIEGVDWNLEIGAINEIMAERKGPAVVFDKIKDYPAGYRVATNITSQGRFSKNSFWYT